MAQITRLLSAQLARALGLRETGALSELADTVLPVLSIEPYLMPPEGATPAPVGAFGLQPQIIIGTGARTTAASTYDQGVLEVFGAGVISGPVPANRFASHAAAPNRDWKVWGAQFFIGAAQLARLEMNGSIVRQSAPLDPAAEQPGNTLEKLFWWAADKHSDGASPGAGWNENFHTVILPVPYVIGSSQQLYFVWGINNLLAVANTGDVHVNLFWEYA